MKTVPIDASLRKIVSVICEVRPSAEEASENFVSV